MAKAPAFQFYSADFYMDTADWTISETGIYIRLLMYQWINIELPSEMSRLARIAGCDVRTLQKCWSQCLGKKLSTTASGGLQNYRLEEVRKERAAFLKNAEEAGRLGGLKTQENRRKQANNPLSNPSSQNQALQSSSSTSKKPLVLDAKCIQLGSYLLTSILEQNPTHKLHTLSAKQTQTQIEKWGKDIDYMVRIDKRKEQDIRKVIKFATENDFWKANILSGKKLREKYDTLFARLSTPTKTQNQNNATKEWESVSALISAKGRTADITVLSESAQKAIHKMRGLSTICEMAERDSKYKFLELIKEVA